MLTLKAAIPSAASRTAASDPLADIRCPVQNHSMTLFKSLLIVPAFGSTSSAETARAATQSVAVAEEIERGYLLRERYNLPKPTGTSVVAVDSVAVHHLRSEGSTVVWRDESGQWRWDQAIEIGPGGLLAVDRKLESHEAKALTAAEGRLLDKLIRSRTLYSEPLRRTGRVGIGAPFHVMSIDTPFGRRMLRCDGRLRGKAGALADIVLGHD